MENDGGPKFELPSQPKTPEQGSEQRQGQAVEQQQPAKQEAGVGKAAPQPGSTAVDLAQPKSAVTIPSDEDETPAAPVSPTTAKLKAGDVDLIEKQWVNKAKAIVEKTRDDPHLQKSEMSKVKADYIQKRYNKIIKTDDAVAT